MPSTSALSPLEEILDVSAKLFVGRGYAGTSTREIADAAGIRQASLYYHFAGKDEILSELLASTVRPTLDNIGQIESAVPADVPGAAVYLLAATDMATLARAPHNIGLLPRLPDVIHSSAGGEYAAHRDALREAYTRLGSQALMQANGTTGSDRLGALLLQLVESVVGLRADGRLVTDADLETIGSSCLRLCGLDTESIRHAVRIAQNSSLRQSMSVASM